MRGLPHHLLRSQGVDDLVVVHEQEPRVPLGPHGPTQCGVVLRSDCCAAESNHKQKILT